MFKKTAIIALQFTTLLQTFPSYLFAGVLMSHQGSPSQTIKATFTACKTTGQPDKETSDLSISVHKCVIMITHMHKTLSETNNL